MKKILLFLIALLLLTGCTFNKMNVTQDQIRRFCESADIESWDSPNFDVVNLKDQEGVEKLNCLIITKEEIQWAFE